MLLIGIFSILTGLLVSKKLDLYFVDYFIKSIVAFAFFMIMIYSLYRENIMKNDSEVYKRSEFYRTLSIVYGFLAIILFIKSIIFYGDFNVSSGYSALETINNIKILNVIYYILEIVSLLYITWRYVNKRIVSIKKIVIGIVTIICITAIGMIQSIYLSPLIHSILETRSLIVLVGYLLVVLYINLHEEIFDYEERNIFTVYIILRTIYYMMISLGDGRFNNIYFYIIETIFVISQYIIIKLIFVEILIKPYERINKKQSELLIWQETVLKNIPDGVLLRQGKYISYANETFKNIFKIPTDMDLVGKNIYELFSNEDIKYIKQLEDDIHKKRHILSKPYKYTLYDSSIIDVEESAMLLPYGERDIYLFICRDLEDRKNYESMLLTLKQKEEDEKLKNEFISNISHELKTPLNVIYAATQMQYTNYSNNKPQDNKKYTKSIKQNCLRLIRLINNIIDVTKIEGGYFNVKPKKINIVEEVEKITDSIVDYAKSKDLEMIFDTTEEEMYCYCDEDSVERIVLNLLSNAIKYNVKYGKIIVTINRDDDYAFIAVEDTGKGIDNEKLHTIYNRFERIDNTLSRYAEGSGIGLNITKSIIELNKGSISAFSEIDKGTKIVVKLPLFKGDFEEVNTSFDTNEIKNNLIERIEVEFSDIYF